jgi:hypothetical protein
MIWLLLIIPIIVCVTLFLVLHKHIALMSYLIIIIPSILLIVGLDYGMIIANESDVEYNGYYIKKVRYYEPWDEWIHKTCSYTTCSGSGKTRSCVTHYYDCSYRKYHSEYWVMVDNVIVYRSIPLNL